MPEGTALVAIEFATESSGGARFESVAQTRALGASPASGAERGGAAVAVVGSGFARAPPHGSAPSAPDGGAPAAPSASRTVAPAGVAGRVVPVEARAAHAFGSNAWTVDGAARFAYHAERFVDGVSLDVADVAGGADVVVFGGGGGRDAVPLCFFGDVAVDAEATDPARWRSPGAAVRRRGMLGWTAMVLGAVTQPGSWS